MNREVKQSTRREEKSAPSPYLVGGALTMDLNWRHQRNICMDENREQNLCLYSRKREITTKQLKGLLTIIQGAGFKPSMQPS